MWSVTTSPRLKNCFDGWKNLIQNQRQSLAKRRGGRNPKIQSRMLSRSLPRRALCRGFTTFRPVQGPNDDLARIAEQRERAQSKETQRKQELRKMARKRSLARANPEKSPYHMDIPTALRYLRASEVGRSPLDSVISITTGVVAPKGNPKLSGSISFPKPLKETKILVFTTVEEQHEIIGAVVSKIGGLELIEEVKKGMDLDYDMAFATPEMVQHLNPVARILGPKGLMPTVKKGTVAENLFDLIKSQAGSSPFRQKTEQISLPIGRVNFSDDEIIKNLVEAKKALERAISEQKVKRQSILGQTVISSTHGPGMIIKC